MKFPFFASFIILSLITARAIKRNNKLYSKEETSFWEQESAANEVRRKPLDSLSFLSFDASGFLPKNVLKDSYDTFCEANPRLKEIEDRLTFLSTRKMANLSAFTNTELKLSYGVANLKTLWEYDGNYSELITLLQEYASILADGDYIEEAVTVLEYAISAGSDISGSYELCCSLYQTLHRPEKIAWLFTKAEELPSSRRNVIVRKLKESDPYNG